MTESIVVLRGPEFLWQNLPEDLQDSNPFGEIAIVDPELKAVVMSTSSHEKYSNLLDWILIYSQLQSFEINSYI